MRVPQQPARLLAVGVDREALAALAATGREDLAATAALGPGAETVATLTLDSAGLVRPLHD